MAYAAAPEPIVGTPIDPSPTDAVPLTQKLERFPGGRVLDRTIRRYTQAKVGLLASGTGYYMFLSLFSLLAFAYGVIAVVGADALATTLTDALDEALPGLVGEEGIDPAQLRATGAAAGIIGLVVLLYSSLGAIGGVSSSLRLIYGSPPDTRMFISAKLRLAGILLIVAPLMVASFAVGSLPSDLFAPLLDAAGLTGTGALAVLAGAGVVVSYLVDILILWILLGRLGGIRPDRRPLMIACAVGAVAVGVIKQILDALVAWALDKPEYGAFAAPLAVLFILALMATVLYLSACLAAGIGDAGRVESELAAGDDALAEPA